MSSSKKILCTCKVAGCFQLDDTDPVTGKQVKGCYLPIQTVYSHRTTEKQERVEREVGTSSQNGSLPEEYPKPWASRVDVELLQIPPPPHSAPATDLSNELIANRSKLTMLREVIISRCEGTEFPIRLTFDIISPYQPTLDFQYLKDYKLRHDDAKSVSLMQFEGWLNGAFRWANGIDCCQDADLIATQEEIKALITSAKQRLYAFIEQEWVIQHQRQSMKTMGIICLDSEKYILQHRSYIELSPVVFISALMAAVLRVLCLLSRERCGFILSMVDLLVDNALLIADPDNDTLRDNMASWLPKDIRKIEKYFNLDPVYDTYVTCTICRALYKANNVVEEGSNRRTGSEGFVEEESGESTKDVLQYSNIPDLCPHKELEDEDICGTPLFEELNTVTGKRRPMATFLMHDFPTWFAAFISRPEIERVICQPLQRINQHPPNEYRSIWDGPVIRDLSGPDGLPFYRAYGSEIRASFGLCFDGVNPFGNKSAGKQISVGAIYLKCFNLPDHLIDLQENLFCVCIINGPSAPSLSEINHYLRPLINHFERFWADGYYLNRTTLYPEGRLARGAIIPLIMDLHAIRQIIGTGSHNAKFFCTFCSLPIQDIENYDPTTWPLPKSPKDHLQLAELWKNAPTKKKQNSLFKENSIRWTEFFRLSYFTPTLNTTIDPMHGFQNVFRSHICQIWQVDHEHPSGDGLFVGKRPINRSKKKLTSAELIKVLQAFTHGHQSVLKQVPKVVLYHLCEIHSLRRAHNRTQMCQVLKTFFDEHPLELKKTLTLVKRGQMGGDLDASREFQSEFYEAYKVLADTNIGIDCQQVLKDSSKKLLQALCDEVKIDYSHGDTRSQLIKYLMSARSLFIGKAIPMHILPSVGKAVLGSDMVKEINEDFNRTILPSWVSPGPKSFDSSKHCKLSAYEWRTTALIRLAISLPRLWGPRDGRHMEMLTNFMHLLNATIISSCRVVVPSIVTQNSTASLFRREYSLYLRGRVELYPTGKIQPTEHLLYHIGDQLDKLGPLPKLSTNVFERYNGRLQDQPTNSRVGELEGTLFRGFCKTANLRSLMTHAEHLGIPDNLRNRFDKVFNILGGSSLFDGTMNPRFNSPNMDDLQKVKKSFLGPNVTELFKQCIEREGSKDIAPLELLAFDKLGWEVSRCQRNGVTYTVADFHKRFATDDGRFNAHRDSHVLIESSNFFLGKPHSIRKIFALDLDLKKGKKLGIYLLVHAYKDLADHHLPYDHWRKFPLSGGRLYYDSLEETEKVVSLEKVLGHFVKTPYEDGSLIGIEVPCIHVLPLPWHHAFENISLQRLEEEENPTLFE